MSKFKKIILKKQVIISLLIVILVLTGVINWVGVDRAANPVLAPVADVTSTPAPLDFFAQTAMDRDTQRATTIQNLQANNQTDEIAKQNKYAQQEATIETLIKAKGYVNAVAYITDTTGTFVVQAQGLTATDVAQIKDIIIANSNLDATQIRISEHN